jgi:phage terminase small subunit
MTNDPKPPEYLSEASREWWAVTVAEFDLEPHHIRLLTLAAEAFDRAQEARERIAEDGAYVTDRFGQLRPHPGVAIERDSRLAFARMVRELNLSSEAPSDFRPPRLSV